MTSKQLILFGKLAGALAIGAALVIALVKVLTTHREPPQPPPAVSQVGAPDVLADPPAEGGPGRVLFVTTMFTAESGPAVAYRWGTEPCWPQRLPTRAQVTAVGRAIPIQQAWSVCVLPAEAELSNEVWESLGSDAGVSPDVAVLAFDLRHPEQARQGTLVGAAVGYCADDGWCAATLVWGPSMHRPSLSASLPTRQGRAVYVQAKPPPAPGAEAWEELEADIETDSESATF